MAKGAKHVVLKGIQREGETCIRNFVGGLGMDTVEVHNEYLPYMLHGTGDLYASCLMAAVMAGRTLEEAVRFAGDFVHDAMIVSAKQPEFRDRGVSFEPLLGKVCGAAVEGRNRTTQLTLRRPRDWVPEGVFA